MILSNLNSRIPEHILNRKKFFLYFTLNMDANPNSQQVNITSSDLAAGTAIDESNSSPYDDPKNWSTKRKTLILIIVSFASMISPMTST